MIGLEYVGRGADVVVVLASGLPLGLQRLLGLPDAFLLVLETKAKTLSKKLLGWAQWLAYLLTDPAFLDFYQRKKNCQCCRGNTTALLRGKWAVA